MPRCKKCGKKGLFLKIEGVTGLCLSCNEEFARKGKILTEKIIEAKNSAATAKERAEVVGLCESVEQYGTQLIALHKDYNLEPSQELLDLIEAHKRIRETLAE
jgi:hypothetical protein